MFAAYSYKLALSLLLYVYFMDHVVLVLRGNLCSSAAMLYMHRSCDVILSSEAICLVGITVTTVFS